VCGICGKLNFEKGSPVSPRLLKAMADSIIHRGPDDEGYYTSGSVGFGFRRLSIIDLDTGHQPICNEDESVWIVFNGEIYNYRELRELLIGKGHRFQSKTDTEVIVHLYEEYGVACIEKLRGMFAFAIWDERTQTMLLARDRVGIKPLYYRLTDSSLIFGSEIKAILADPEVHVEVDPQMIGRFLTFLYTPGEETLFGGIRKLAPGHYLSVQNGKVQIGQYWDLRFEPVAMSPKRAEERLLDLLEETVELHMLSDVPVGVLLSGGVDSTALLGFAAEKTTNKLSTYTIGFSGMGVTDERPYARQAATRYGTEHHEMTISSDEFASFLPQFVRHMEEPVCEPPAVALYYVSRMAKDFVKVLISGEGGDEAFAGYPNYRSMAWMERFKTMCGSGTALASAIVGLTAKLPGAQKLRKFAPLFNLPFEDYYYSRTSTPLTFFNASSGDVYTDEFLEIAHQSDWALPARQYMQTFRTGSTLNRMLYVDTKTWLPDDLLIKADKITMANSIELRVPLLDHVVLEFAASLPDGHKLHGLTTKYLARRALRKKVPKEILQRKKAGFPVPYDSWLRGPLKAWLGDILLDNKTVGRGYFRRSAIEKLLCGNNRNGSFSKELFSLAILELWHREFADRCSSISPSTNDDISAVSVTR
jgi:asparagine synthase (glutamine-hydrolysing)